ncbi:formate dehydrogenase-N subunit alpha [Wohlfahrtiimonas chitiniclastica]|nr:formate dehydrogenase-N subunit alpha [Wohlfahrtiimonas chitiniclastica]
MTNHWVDIKNADVVIVMGGNAAEAHPVGFRWVVEAKQRRGATFVVVDPRFNRSASVADFYAPIRSGTDIAFLGGVINWLIANGKINWDYVKNYTNATFIVHDDFDFNEGLFSGWDKEKNAYTDKSSWNYKMDENGDAVVDPTMEDPRCVFNMMKKHYASYTPELVSTITGTPVEEFLKVCEILGTCSAHNKVATFLYALGWTQHTIGSQNIRTMAMIQLLLGNIGMPGGGVNALRGHSNIQGLTDLGLLSTNLPGYMPLPSEKQTTIDTYLSQVTPKATRPDQFNYWGNTPKFFVSMMKTFWGDKATKENGWGFDWLPKWDQMYDVLRVFELMKQGKMNGYFCQGFNPVASFPNKNKTIAALSKLKYLVVMDPLVTETSTFWKNYGESNDVDPSKIGTTVYRLPTTCFAEEDGAVVNSGRWLQWHWKAADAPGEALPDANILSGILYEVRRLYKEHGGVNPEPLMNISWKYDIPTAPHPDELAKELNGYALADIKDADGNVILKKGQLISSFAQLRDDGTTASGCWIYAGSWTEAGNQMANRDNSDPSGLGNTLGWAWAWPANRRIIYNRASADRDGKAWDKERALIFWNGKKWTGYDVPDFKVDEPPGSAMNPYIMNPEGVSRLYAIDKMAEGPFPAHYEPMESPIGVNLMYPKVLNNPAVRIFEDDRKELGTMEDYPYVGTTYRLTEHFHYWTKHALLNAIAQPEQFIEMGEALAAEKGIANGDWVKVWSKRGFIKAVAVVTKRIKPLDVNGKRIHHIGIPIHWGYEGLTKQGFIANTLTPSVGDANTQTPEFKTFLVNIEKAEGGR